jgi:hypothetical protein
MPGPNNTANELLYGILQTVGKIEQNTRVGRTSGTTTIEPKSKVSILSNLGGALQSFKGVTPKSIKTFFTFMDQLLVTAEKSGKSSKKLKDLSESIGNLGQGLPGLATGLDTMGKIRIRQVERAIHSLDLLYHFMEETGDTRKTAKVNRAIKTFEKIGKSLQQVAKPIKDISLGFAYLGLGILAFAGSLLLTSYILKLSKPTDVLLFLGVTIVGMIVMFGMLYIANRVIKGGTKAITEMGIGLAALSLGIVSFALALMLVPIILGGESGGSIFKSLLIISGIIVATVGMFVLMGFASKYIAEGVGVAGGMALGMFTLSLGIISLAMAAKYLMGGSIFGKDKSKDEKDNNKKSILKGLGAIGLILLAAIGAFTLMGALGEFIIPGIMISLLMSVAFIVLGKSVISLVESSEKLKGKNITESISNMIGGTLTGFIEGISVLSEGKKGIAGIATFIKNSAKIFAGTAVLLSMSLAISAFAYSLKAFAELNNIRLIKEYDKNGKAVFGEKINIKQVSDNISYSISTFLTSLLDSTEGLTRRKAKAIQKMGRALTGRRGILSAVNDFADILKTFSKFGPEGKIGFIEMIPDGTDADGNAKFKQVPKTVKITEVASNIANSFGTFVDELTKHTSMFEITGEKGRSMQKLGEILLGSKYFKVLGLSFGKERPGLLEPITKFSEILSTYSRFGQDQSIPVLNEEGKVIKTVKVSDIANQIVTTLSTFSTVLGNANITGDVKKAEKNISKFDDLIKSISNFSESLTGLEKVNDTVSNLAKSISELSVSLDGFDTAKLQKLSIVTGPTYAPGTTAGTAGTVVQTVTQKTGAAKTISETKKAENWDQIASQIGEQVGSQIVAAMKRGQLKFEFSPSSPGKGIMTFD